MNARPDNMPEKMTAHAVRELTGCAFCGGLGDRRQMLKVEAGHWHTSCAVMEFRADELLAMPSKQLSKLRLCDLQLMKQTDSDRILAVFAKERADK